MTIPFLIEGKVEVLRPLYRSLDTDVVSLTLKAVEYLKLIKNTISLTRANKSRFIKI